MQSVFPQSHPQPANDELKSALQETYNLWESIRAFVLEKNSKAREEWNCSKHGWSLRIKDEKRVIVYLLPRQGFFKVAMVFGQKATDKILQSDIASMIQSELQAAKAYAEGRGIRIDIHNGSLLPDILQLVEIKLAH